MPTHQSWLYLAVLLDLYSRRVVGWAMSDKIDTQLVLDALNMAVCRRRPAPGLIHHTDRDCRYASSDYRAAIGHHEMVASMSGKADCWDNAVAESFFATLEKELLETDTFLTHPRPAGPSPTTSRPTTTTGGVTPILTIYVHWDTNQEVLRRQSHCPRNRGNFT